MQTTPFLVGEKELSLRYETKQQSDIKHNAPKKLFPEVKGLRFQSPMDILRHLDDTDVQIHLIQKGLEWAGSGCEKITFDKAADLRQEYLESGEADAGEKYEALTNLLAEALSLNVMGASGKKLKEKGEASQEKAKTEAKKATVEELATIYEAKILAEARAKEKMDRAQVTSPGTNGSETPSDSA